METITIYPCDAQGKLLPGFCVCHFSALTGLAVTLLGWKKFGVQFYHFDGKVFKL